MTDTEEAYRLASPDTNCYVPLSGGLESLWGLRYAVAHPDLVPIAAHWYDETWGKQFADASLFYAKKQAEYFGIPFGWDSSSFQTNEIPTKYPIPVFFSGMSAFMAQSMAEPKGIKFKYIISPANAEDRQELPVYFRPYRKNIAMYKSRAWDGTAVTWDALRETPLLIEPGTMLTKVEMTAMLMQSDPNVMPYVWTCFHPAALKVDDEITGYKACRKCRKCLELDNALNVAEEANQRYTAGMEYYAKFRRHKTKIRS